MRFNTLRDLCLAEIRAVKVGCRSFLAAAEALHHAAADAELRELLARTLLRMRGGVDVLGAILAHHGAGRAEPGHGGLAALAGEARAWAIRAHFAAAGLRDLTIAAQLRTLLRHADARFAAFEAHAERLRLGRDIDLLRGRGGPSPTFDEALRRTDLIEARLLSELPAAQAA